MRKRIFALLGAVGCTVSFLSGPAAADTISLSDNTVLKGLVVEEHQDRVIVSTGDGEKTVLRNLITNIEYDDLEYNLLALGRKLEQEKKWREALSYYEEALTVNPDLKDAKAAALGVRNRIWAKTLDEGPIGEMEKRQAMQDAWSANADIDAVARSEKVSNDKKLWDRLGLAIAKESEWIAVKKVRFGGPAHKLGLRRGDELISIDGGSLRYLNEAAVIAHLLEPRYSTALLRVQRAVLLEKEGRSVDMNGIGLKLEQEFDGLTVAEAGEKAVSLRPNDIIVTINGAPTRYMPLREAVRFIENPYMPQILLKINRSFTFTRK